MDVALIQWPSDEAMRVELAERQYPRLLLVEAGAEPPICTDILEDWVRLPVAPADADARVRALRTRVEELAPQTPSLTNDGVLEYRGARVQLSPMQARLIQPMLERFDTVIGREALASITWPDGHPTRNNLDVGMGRLRRQLRTVGLQVRTVRSRGYLVCDIDDAR